METTAATNMRKSRMDVAQRLFVEDCFESVKDLNIPDSFDVFLYYLGKTKSLFVTHSKFIFFHSG